MKKIFIKIEKQKIINEVLKEANEKLISRIKKIKYPGVKNV